MPNDKWQREVSGASSVRPSQPEGTIGDDVKKIAVQKPRFAAIYAPRPTKRSVGEHLGQTRRIGRNPDRRPRTFFFEGAWRASTTRDENWFHQRHLNVGKLDGVRPTAQAREREGDAVEPG